jgi:hypothetical protein
MPSPFPGMNPYLEAIWHDVHERFLPVEDLGNIEKPGILLAVLTHRS